MAGDGLTTSYTSAELRQQERRHGQDRHASAASPSAAPTPANYTFNTTASTTANITARALDASAPPAVNKVYDGTTTATVTLADDRLGRRQPSPPATRSASFANKNVGTAKTVTVSGICASAAPTPPTTPANTTASTTADITARALTVSATGVNKVYDGTTSRHRHPVGQPGGRRQPDHQLHQRQLSPTRTSARPRPVSVSGIAISGADAANYTANTTASTTANITAATVTALRHRRQQGL